VHYHLNPVTVVMNEVITEHGLGAALQAPMQIAVKLTCPSPVFSSTMLQTLRDKASGWLVTVVLGLLMIPFVFVVDSNYFGGVGVQNVGRVATPPTWWSSAPSWWPLSLLWNRHDVSIEEFRQHFDQARLLARQQYGDDFDPIQFETEENKRAVLESLIEQHVVRLASETAHISVGDEVVNTYIGRLPEFQSNGQFNEEQYRLILSQNGYTHTGFKQQVRQSLEQTLLPETMLRSSFVTAGERERLLRLLGESRDVELLPLPRSEIDENEAVSAEQVEQWYQSHNSAFIAPESVVIEYVELTQDSVPPLPLADEARLRQRYKDEKTRFVAAQQRQAAHILIAVPAGADAQAQAEAGIKAAMLADQAKQEGADFAALAREHSDDPGSRNQGGDLGWLEPGVMVPAFEEALFAMQPGEVSGPIRTDFGFHVLQLQAVRGGEGRSFDEVRTQLAAEQEQADVEEAFNALAGRLVDAVNSSPSTLEPAAQAVGLEMRTLGPFNRRTATGLAAHPAILRAAFSTILIEDGTVSDLIDISPNHSVMLRVREHQPERLQPLDQVRDQVIAAVRRQRANERAAAAADVLLQQLASGQQDLQSLAQERELMLFPLPQLQRNSQLLPPIAEQAIFTLNPADENTPAYGKVASDEGGYTLFAVTKVTPGNLEDIAPLQQQQLTRELEQLGGLGSIQAWTQNQRQHARIQLRDDPL